MKHRHVEVRVRQYADGRWGFDDYTSGRLKKIRRTTKAKAQARANDVAVILANGRTDLLSITREELAALRALKSAESRTYGDVVEEFAQSKLADCELHGEYVAQLIRIARRFLPLWEDRPIAQITPGEIAAALEDYPQSPRTRNNTRDALVTLWRFARDERGDLPMDGKTAAERVKRQKVRRAVELPTHTPEEFAQILSEARPDFLPSLAIRGLAGIRKHEVRPTSRERGKDPLRWEDFNWRENYVRVRAETSKTGEERIVPVCPALRAILAPYRNRTGPIIAVSDNEEMKRIRAKLGITYRRNGLRHGYGTYRNALIHNIAQVAEELGNTIRTAKNRYVRARPVSEARRWFNPKLAPKTNVISFEKSSTKVPKKPHQSNAKRARIAQYTR